ncbi:MAG: 2-keto-4-pentenoate hydratase/2-oxohepta-3-ene-1,7-dioic acid hydratase in catechol pathway [Phenylobacterium sp.]|jgi:2-keto-4-pentenoate hydratase/2-oxohepta-3-ene-1,7-dioic acid hydratase in catechol pathway
MSLRHFTTNDIGTIYCVGRNYAAHAKELNNPIPSEPVIFTKTRSTACALSGEIAIPSALNRCDHETEIAIRLGQDLFEASAEQVLAAISHYGIGLDLTLREKQTELKQKSYPWDLAKSFINATPLSGMLPFNADKTVNLEDIDFSLSINGEIRQQGNTSNMLFSIINLTQFLSQRIPLQAGDLILTGTPEGVGPVNHNDQLVLSLNGETVAEATIVRA